MAKLTNIPENSRLAINRMPIFSEKEKRLLQVALDAVAESAASSGDVTTGDQAVVNGVEPTIQDQIQELAGNISDWQDFDGNSGQVDYVQKYMYTGTGGHTFYAQNIATMLANDDYTSSNTVEGTTFSLTTVYLYGFMLINGGSGNLTFAPFPASGDRFIVNGVDQGAGNSITLASGEMICYTVNDSDTTSYLVAKVSGSGGSGDVTKVGTPANDQIGVWTGDGTIEGTSGLTYDATALTAGTYVFDTDQSIAGKDGWMLTLQSGTITLYPLDISQDGAPALGGNLDVGTYEIVSSANNDIGITSNGSGNITLSAGTTGDINLTPGSTSGNIVLDYATWPAADSSVSGYVLTTDAAGNLSWTLNGTGTGIGDIVDDVTPQLGADLDSNDFDIDMTNQAAIRFWESGGGTGDPPSGGNYMAIRAATTLGANYVLTLPTTDGSAGEYLKTDGAGVLSWDSPAGGGATAFTDLTDTPGTIPFAQWLKAAPFGGSLEFTAQPVTTLSATSPLARNNDSGDVTISIQAAAGPDQNGYMLGSDKAKLDTITADADPTTTATVAAAGAVMDSDLPALGLHATSFGGIAGRTLVSSDGTVSITYGDGYAGNPDLSVAGVDGTKVTVSASAPGSPSVGDLWIDIS